MLDRVREGQLCWAQHRHFFSQGSWLPSVVDVPAEVERSRIELALAAVIERHEILRTTFQAGLKGGVRQIVWSPDARPVNLSPTLDGRAQWRQPSGGVPADAMNAIQPFYQESDDLPFRYALEVSKAEKLRLHLAVHHVAADHYGLQILANDIKHVLTHPRSAEMTSYSGIHPTDISEYEQSPSGAKVNNRAVRYWLDHLGSLNEFHGQLWRHGPEEGDTEIVAGRTSTTAQKKILKLAATNRVPPSAVVISAIANAFKMMIHNQYGCFSISVSNRHLPGTTDAVCTLAQPGLLVTPNLVSSRPGTLSRRYLPAVLSATRHAHYDPHALNAACEARLPDWNSLQRGLVNINFMMADRNLRIAKLNADDVASERSVVRKISPHGGRGGGIRFWLHPNGARVLCSTNSRLMNEGQVGEFLSTVFSILEIES